MRLIDKTPCDPFREGLARLFGASLKIVARKRGQPVETVGGRLKGSFPESDGVILGFEPHMLKLLGQKTPLFPICRRRRRMKSSEYSRPRVETRNIAGRDSHDSRRQSAVAPMRLALPPGPTLVVFRVYGHELIVRIA